MQSVGNGAGHLRDFEGVREAITEMIGVARGEDLRLGFEAAESAGVDDAVAVAGVIVAIGVLRVRGAAAAKPAWIWHGPGRGKSHDPQRLLKFRAWSKTGSGICRYLGAGLRPA